MMTSSAHHTGRSHVSLVHALGRPPGEGLLKYGPYCHPRVTTLRVTTSGGDNTGTGKGCVRQDEACVRVTRLQGWRR
eukprot:370952-Pyramimonas_sp.AAC.1